MSTTTTSGPIRSSATARPLRRRPVCAQPDSGTGYRTTRRPPGGDICHAEYDLTDSLTLIVGARYTNESRDWTGCTYVADDGPGRSQ